MVVERAAQRSPQEFGDARRTVLKAGAELAYDAEAYVVHEDATVVVTRDGWMKRVGEIKDPSSTRVREGDQAKWILRGNTRDSLALLLQLRRRLRDEGHQRARHHRLRRAGADAAQLQGRRTHRRRRSRTRRRRARRDRRARPARASSSAPKARRAPERVHRAARGRRADGARRSLAGRHRRRHGLLLPSGPQRDDAQRTALRPHQGRRRPGHASPRPTATPSPPSAQAGKVLSFPAEELPELAGAGRGVILMRLDADETLVGGRLPPAGRPPDRHRRRRQRAPRSASRSSPTAPRRGGRP